MQYLEGGGASLRKQYAGLFGKIAVDEEGVISLAHPRVAREFLVNIGTIVSESFVDVFLRRRRLGSVEENFIKQLQIGDLFVLGGRIVRLIDTGLQAAYVERADGHLPTVPRWNAAKMPLTSGLAEGVRNLRAEIAERLATETEESPALDWLVEDYEISSANAEAILELFRAQLSVSELPVGRKMLVEIYREAEHSALLFPFAHRAERERCALPDRGLAGEESAGRERAGHDRRLRFSAHAAAVSGNAAGGLAALF